MTAHEARQKTAINQAEHKRLQAIKFEKDSEAAICKVYEAIEKAVANREHHVEVNIPCHLIIGTKHEQRLKADGYEVSLSSKYSIYDIVEPSIIVSWKPYNSMDHATKVLKAALFWTLVAIAFAVAFAPVWGPLLF